MTRLQVRRHHDAECQPDHKQPSGNSGLGDVAARDGHPDHEGCLGHYAAKAITGVLLALVVSVTPAFAQVFGSDVFTDTTSDELTTQHTPDLGGPWVLVTGTTGGMQIDTNRARCTSAASVCAAYLTVTPSSADYRVQATIRRFTNVAYPGLSGRMSTVNTSRYSCIYDSAAAEWELREVDTGGTSLVIGTPYSQVLVDATDYTVMLELIGTSIKCYINGVERIATTDGTLTGAGRAGYDFYDASSGSTGYHLDNFEASYISSGTIGRQLLLGVGQ